MDMNDKPFLQKMYTRLRNPVSVTGLLIALVCTAIGLPMMFIDIFFGSPNPYTGIVTYLVFPAVSAIGVLVAVIGAIWAARKKAVGSHEKPIELPTINFNNPHHRKVALATLGLVLVGFSLLAVTSYRAYHFSDSTEFCGQACHGVMKPEYTAYQHSPHARVGCVSCHIGPGAGWFVKSKITGAYQVYSVAFNKYSRPIEAPIKDLRPAQDTCEQCHWPAKFFGAQQKTFTHFLSDETNTPWEIQTLLKIGGGDEKTGASSGVHWHMNIANEISYRDVDGKRLTIPWVRSVSKDGKVVEYVSSESPLSAEELEKMPIRRMDCLDCHNRPSHRFPPPSESLDHAFAASLLDTSLPYLKREAVRVMSNVYSTEAEGRAAIEKELKEFYQANHPAIVKDKSLALNKAVGVVQDVFSRSIFPEMKADWRAYPSHIGHMTADGCFRCHDGLHQSAEGKVITNDCNACHTILAQGPPAAVTKARLEAQPFKHPVDLGTDVTTMKCSICHGAAPN